jgi:hypothetical protein
MFVLDLLCFSYIKQYVIFSVVDISEVVDINKADMYVQCDTGFPSDLFILRRSPNSSCPNTLVPIYTKCSYYILRVLYLR